MGAEEYDVVVLGTGAAGLTAALAAAQAGASVGLFEKGTEVGGTTCLSSGVAWLPANPLAVRAGVPDSREEGLAYLGSLSRGLILPELAEAFVDTVGELVAWLEERTPLRLQLIAPYPDYHPERPGGKPGGGRSVEPELFPVPRLGEWAGRMVGAVRRTAVSESPMGGGTGVLAPEVLAARDAEDLEGGGRGMVAALLRGCLDAGIEPVTGARGLELVVEDGRVAGVRLERDGRSEVVRARSGVVLATGGFEWDAELVRDFLRGPIAHPASVPTNTGDGLRMAMRVGAGLGTMREAWWAPVCVLPGRTIQGQQAVYLVNRERTLPGSILVNRDGRRFTNEAANYNALGGAFHTLDPATLDYRNHPCWLVWDDACARRYGGFGLGGGQAPPDWVLSAGSLPELAASIDVPADTLVATVQRWNASAERAEDPDFGRGRSAYDRFLGDRSLDGPASTVGPLTRGPFHAVQVFSSTLGTKGGPRTTVDGAVLDVDGDVVPGLFAAGNAMAGPTGMVYGGAGGTLGPALVFGYRAGRAVAGVPVAAPPAHAGAPA
ncbi:FAD binding domain-containing protein [Geodermatophilus amargosae]|uniref:FAD binding domain-containing protein n=1 Tax=Geodermatophilus amargosae TaxID=1296565 RepID=A0A1I7C239_9ACTN|nr:FAD-dependent oxidoreductase [Geodermatophilus amargosae]SFT93507.1 FAD binding domain-containing protein [Geodermatophilus amargosae]